MKHSLSKFSTASLSLPLCAALVLGAASSGAAAHDSTTANHANHANKHHKASKTKTVPANYLKGTVKTSKTGMGVQLDFAFSSAGVDRLGLLQLTITRRGGGEDATIAIQPDPGLLLAEGLPSSPAPFNPGASYILKVKPAADGLRYLNVFFKSGSMAEALAIPVQLGKDANLRKSGAVKTTPEGQRVISIPAQ